VQYRVSTKFKTALGLASALRPKKGQDGLGDLKVSQLRRPFRNKSVNHNCSWWRHIIFESPPLSGVISHAHIAQDRSWYGTMTVPRPILCFTQARVKDLLSHHSWRKEKEEGRKHIYPYFHLLFFV